MVEHLTRLRLCNRPHRFAEQWTLHPGPTASEHDRPTAKRIFLETLHIKLQTPKVMISIACRAQATTAPGRRELELRQLGFGMVTVAIFEIHRSLVIFDLLFL